MTVKELIEKLLQFDENMQVIAGFEEIDKVEILKDFCYYGNTVVEIK